MRLAHSYNFIRSYCLGLSPHWHTHHLCFFFLSLCLCVSPTLSPSLSRFSRYDLLLQPTTTTWNLSALMKLLHSDQQQNIIIIIIISSQFYFSPQKELCHIKCTSVRKLYGVYMKYYYTLLLWYYDYLWLIQTRCIPVQNLQQTCVDFIATFLQQITIHHSLCRNKCSQS